MHKDINVKLSRLMAALVLFFSPLFSLSMIRDGDHKESFVSQNDHSKINGETVEFKRRHTLVESPQHTIDICKIRRFSTTSALESSSFDPRKVVYKIDLKLFLDLFDDFSLVLGDLAIERSLGGNYSFFDPILNDWGCPLRAFWISKFIRDFKIGAYQNEDNILARKILGYVYFLTKTSHLYKANLHHDLLKNYNLHVTDTKFLDDNFMNFLTERGYVPSEDIGSRTVQRFYYWIKKILLQHQNIILRKQFEYYDNTIPKVLLEKFMYRLSNPYTLKLSHVDIPVFPEFESTLMYIELSKASKYDTIVKLRRIIKDGSNIYDQGCITLIYRWKERKWLKSNNIITVDHLPLPKLELYSARVIGNDADSPDYTFHSKDSFDEFVETLINEVDLEDFLLQNLAFHPQFGDSKNNDLYENDILFKNELVRYKELAIKNKFGTSIYLPSVNPPFEFSMPLNALHLDLSSFSFSMSLDG